jgi:hypothetical protein
MDYIYSILAVPGMTNEIGRDKEIKNGIKNPKRFKAKNIQHT